MSEPSEIIQPKTVYIRSLDRDTLPEELRTATAGLPAPCSVHAPNGDRLAIVRDRRLAFILARQNDLSPVYVH